MQDELLRINYSNQKRLCLYDNVKLRRTSVHKSLQYPLFMTNNKDLIGDRFYGDSLSHPDVQPELDMENGCPNKTGHNLKTNFSISIL